MTQSKQHWEQVYSEKTPVEVSWFQSEPTMSLQVIQAALPNHNDAIIDVGGGASRLVDHLLDRGYNNVAVLDISSQAIEHAKTRLGPRADQVEWFIQDITQFQAPRKFHCWHDRAVFHFLTDSDDRQRYVENLNRALESNADVLIATFAIGGPEKCSGLDIVQYDAEKIQEVLGAEFELLDVKHEIHITPGNAQQKFNYFHFRKIQ